MTLLLAILPLVFLITAMTCRRPRPWLPLPAHVALPGAGLLAYSIALVAFGHLNDVDIHAAALQGVLSALTPLGIVFGAVLLFKTLEHSGAMAVISGRLRQLSPDPVAQLILIGWSFSFLIEGLSGFGTPAVLAAPLLVGLGFPPLRVAAMCLIMNSVPVSFGAVGTPMWFGLSGVELKPDELSLIAWRTALTHAAAAPPVVVLALLTVLSWSAIRARMLYVVLVTASTVVPYVIAAGLTTEFPSIVGGMCGLLAAAALARWRIGLPRSTAGSSLRDAGTFAQSSIVSNDAPQSPPQPTRSGISLFRAITPLLATVLLLAITRIEEVGLKRLLTSDAAIARLEIPHVGEAWTSAALVIGISDLLGTTASWKMPLLYVPFIVPFVVVAIGAIPWLHMSRASVKAAWGETGSRMTHTSIALAGALVLTHVLTCGGQESSAMVLGQAMAEAGGSAWTAVASLLGALGAFFSGSNTVSNLTFAPVQASIAEALGLDRITVLAMQCVGGAMGNMICIHNIIAVGAVLGLWEKRGSGRDSQGFASVLRLTVGPMCVYAMIAAGAAGIFTLMR